MKPIGISLLTVMLSLGICGVAAGQKTIDNDAWDKFVRKMSGQPSSTASDSKKGSKTGSSTQKSAVTGDSTTEKSTVLDSQGVLYLGWGPRSTVETRLSSKAEIYYASSGDTYKGSKPTAASGEWTSFTPVTFTSPTSTGITFTSPNSTGITFTSPTPTGVTFTASTFTSAKFTSTGFTPVNSSSPTFTPISFGTR
jgi:hypothetical protein